MSYQVLYRAWRPGTFSEICGQEAVTRTLKRQVLSDRIAHAYLFCGTRGTGKTTAAKVLSKAINCLKPDGGDPCGECEICRALQAENCMDVVEIDAASNNGVDEIRDLREKIKYPPSLTRYKVYIIDEVHMLSTGAFNALLKTLEEPPRHAVFILATTEPQRLPATILSRCQRFDFKRISVETIVDRMMVVLGGIGREADDDALYEIARAAEGAMRDALSLLDCCLSYTDGSVTLQLARDVLGTAGRAFLFDFADALIDFDVARALLLIDEMMRKGSDPQVFARDTVAHLRAILLAGAVGDVSELLEVTPEDAARFVEQSRRISSEKLMRMLDLYMRVEPDMRWATRPRTMLELATVRACHPEQEPDAALIERVARIEALMAKGVPTAPTEKQSPKAAAPKSTEANPEKSKDQPREPEGEPPAFYHEALEKLMEEIPSTKVTLASMHFLNFADDVITVEFPKKLMMHLRMLERKREAIEQILTACAGRPITIQMLTEGQKTPVKSGIPSVAKQVIEESLDIFPRDKINLVD